MHCTLLGSALVSPTYIFREKQYCACLLLPRPNLLSGPTSTLWRLRVNPWSLMPRSDESSMTPAGVRTWNVNSPRRWGGTRQSEPDLNMIVSCELEMVNDGRGMRISARAGCASL